VFHVQTATGDEATDTVTYEWRVVFSAQPSAFLSATAVNKLVAVGVAFEIRQNVRVVKVPSHA
jgi:hypothetical protein